MQEKTQYELVLAEALKELGVDFTKNDKEERYMAMCYCYILNKFFDLGIRPDFVLEGGIFSKSIYAVIDKAYSRNLICSKNLDFKYKLNEYAKEVLNKIKYIFPSKEDDTLRKLNLYVVYDFFRIKCPSMTKDEIIKKLGGETSRKCLDDIIYQIKSLYPKSVCKYVPYRRLTSEHKKYILENYKNMSIPEMSQNLGFDRQTIKAFLKRTGIVDKTGVQL